MMLEVKNLIVTFPLRRGALQAVRGVSFSMVKGEVLGIVGESGSGKSVTAQALMRLLPVYTRISGKILFEGQDVGKMEKKDLPGFRGSKIAMIFQEPGRSFDPLYNMEKTFRETLKLHHPEETDEQLRERTLNLMREVQIPQPEDRLGNYPHQFSGGQLQRMMIALALASDPELLIADEPTTALDVTIQAQIIELLLKIKAERGMGIIFISHDLDLVSRVADRILVMYGGLVMEEGDAGKIYQSPAHPYSRGLLHSMPSFGTHYSRDRLITIPGNVPNPIRPEPGCPFAPRCSYRQEKCIQALPEVRLIDERNSRCILENLESMNHE